MSFLAPLALVIGVAAAAGAVLLHLVARHRPAAFILPTARFIPDTQTVVSRAASRPRDLLLLALRVLLLLCAGAAFAHPVLVGAHAPRGRIVLLDRSAAVADAADAWRRARGLLPAEVPGVLVGFDSVAAAMPAADTSASAPASRGGAGSLGAALVAAQRAAPALAERADSVELVIVSPIAASEVDAATLVLRGTWPGGVRVERVAMRVPDTTVAVMERAIALSDALGPSLARMPVRAGERAVRVIRSAAMTARDSTFARGGGTVVLWDSASAPLIARGLAMGDDVIVAPLGRRAVRAGDEAIVRWADGAPAAMESTLGQGCTREVGIVAPSVGDLALRPGFQRIVRGLVAPCSTRRAETQADSALVQRLIGGSSAAPASAFGRGQATPSRLVPWLLGVALACALLELLLRLRTRSQEPA